jgi:hypothetical protein
LVNDGASFTELTVNTNVSVIVWLLLPLTVTVMVDVPKALATGLTVSVRVAPLPEIEILVGLFGTNVVLLELAVTPVIFAAPPTLKGSDSEPSSLIACAARSGNETCASYAPMSTVSVVSASGPSTFREKPAPR